MLTSDSPRSISYQSKIQRPSSTTTGSAGRGKPIVEIYTDWANHYLDKLKGRSKILHIKNIQLELSDGLVLADIIEAVTQVRVPGIHRKPKTSSACIQNIQACLNFLNSKGISGITDISAKDIKDGNLRPILGLFFQLSKYKQHQNSNGIASLTDKKHDVPAKVVTQKNENVGKMSMIRAPQLSSNNSMALPPRNSFPKNRFDHGQNPENRRSIPLRDNGNNRSSSSSSGFSSNKSNSSDSSFNFGSDVKSSSSVLPRITEEPKSSLKSDQKFYRLGGSPKELSKISKAFLPPSSNLNHATEIKFYGPIDGEHYMDVSTKSDQFAVVQPLSKTYIQSYPINEGELMDMKVQPASNTDDKELHDKIHPKSPRSLPRPKRRDDCSPGPSQVAVVSPMPTSRMSTCSSNVRCVTKSFHDSDETLKAVVPMKPLDTLSSRQELHLYPSGASKKADSVEDTNSGYLSDGNIVFNGVNKWDTARKLDNVQTSIYSDDKGYMSEGGSSLYAQKIRSKIAKEKKKVVEEQRIKFEEIGFPRKSKLKFGPNAVNQLPDVLKPQRGQQLTKESNLQSRLNHTKSTISSLNGVNSWKRHGEPQTVLNQDKAMEEYLERQKLNADRRIKMLAAKNATSQRFDDSGEKYGPAVSMPATPAQYRKNETQRIKFGFSEEIQLSPTNQRITNRDMKSMIESGSKTPRKFIGGSLERHAGRSMTNVYDTSLTIGSFDFSTVPNETAISKCETVYQQNYPNLFCNSNQEKVRKEKEENMYYGSNSLPRGTISPNLTNEIQNFYQENGSLNDDLYSTNSCKPNFQIGGINAGCGNSKAWMHPASTYASAISSIKDLNHENDIYGPLNLEVLGSMESINSVSSSIQQARANGLNRIKVTTKNCSFNHSTNYSAVKPTSYNKNSVTLLTERSNSVCNRRKSSNDAEYYEISNVSQSNMTLPVELEDKSEYTMPKYSKASAVVIASENSLKHAKLNSPIESTVYQLRQELLEEHAKVLSLTSQLSTNSHVVSAFEKSFSNMTDRLHQLSLTAEEKEAELEDLRNVIRQLLKDSETQKDLKIKSKLPKQISTDYEENSTANDFNNTSTPKKSNFKKSSWFRHSITKAFSKQNDLERSLANSSFETSVDEINAKSNINTSGSSTTESVEQLKEQLRVKECLLTDTRLESLTSAHHLEALKNALTQMRSELVILRNDNEKLHSIALSKSLSSSQTSLGISDDFQFGFNLNEQPHFSVSNVPATLNFPSLHIEDGKIVAVYVMGKSGNDFSFPIGTVTVTGTTAWDALESMVNKVFLKYLAHVDPLIKLNLNEDSISHYWVGEIKYVRLFKPIPELLPYGYLVGDTTKIKIHLKHSWTHLDSLAFESFISKHILERYVDVLKEKRQIIFTGPDGCGKSYMAKKLAEFVVQKYSLESSVEIFSFDLHLGADEQKDFKHFLCQNHAENSHEVLLVLILFNLQYITLQMSEEFVKFLTIARTTMPYIICTYGKKLKADSLTSTPSLVSHHGFTLINYDGSNGFLERHLRSKMITKEVRSGTFEKFLFIIVEWLCKLWEILRNILNEQNVDRQKIREISQSFMECPLDILESRNWFINLWNSTLNSLLSKEFGGGNEEKTNLFSLIETKWPWLEPLPNEILLHLKEI